MLVGALRRPHPGQNPGIGSSNQIFKAMNVRLKQTLVRRYREIQQIARDPILMVGLLVSSSFVFLFVLWPLFKVVRGGFFDFNTGAFSLEYFDRYVDPYYAHHSWTTLRDTMVMGLSAAAGGTILGFIFAYTLVRCGFPFSRAAHALTLVPTISPPFAIAMAVILLFGRSGLVTRDWLGIEFGQGVNDVYGLDGLVFVQIITFFPVAYLIMRAMLERLDPAMEEAAQSLGASKLRIFRTVTLPLLVPGVAGSFLLLFVESLADLGNPLLLTGTRNVLSTEIFLAVNGEYNQQKAAALSFVLLIPTLSVFILQRYWVSRRSYISVTGKPTGGQLKVREWYIRWPFLLATGLTLVLVAALYLSIALGSITKLWGIDYTLSLDNYRIALTRGVEAILDTTFLSAIATPLAGLLGMVIAFLVVRRNFSGKEALDFISNLGAAVPGTILGIGFIIAFIGAPWPALILIFTVFLLYFLSNMTGSRREKVMMAVLGVGVGGVAAWWAPRVLLNDWMIAIAAMVLSIVLWLIGRWSARPQQRRLVSLLLLFPIIGLVLFVIGPYPTIWLSQWGRSLGGNSAKVLTSLADWVDVFTQIPFPAHGLLLLGIGGLVLHELQPSRQRYFTVFLLALGALLIFTNKPLALVGSSYIIIAAYAVRSLPASLRAAVASLQQIDPALEEASTSLGADSQITFRRVTLPLIAPAFLAGLIFAFARHMTSLSAIIFLTTPKWRILTVQILSEVEQGGMNIATAYAMIVILIVLAAIGLFYLLVAHFLGTGSGIDLSSGAG